MHKSRKDCIYWMRHFDQSQIVTIFKGVHWNAKIKPFFKKLNRTKRTVFHFSVCVCVQKYVQKFESITKYPSLNLCNQWLTLIRLCKVSVIDHKDSHVPENVWNDCEWAHTCVDTLEVNIFKVYFHSLVCFIRQIYFKIGSLFVWLKFNFCML